MADADAAGDADEAGGMDVLETDSIATSPGDGYYRATEDGSRLSSYQNLTGHPPAVNGIADGEHRLMSNIVHDGSEDARKQFNDLMQGRQRVMNDLQKMYQMCEALFMENEQLRTERKLCGNCRLSLTRRSERTNVEQDLQRELDEANIKVAQLRLRCQELLDEVKLLRKNGTCHGVKGNMQCDSNVESREGSLTTPKQTDSVGNAFHSVDPLLEAAREGGKECGERSRFPEEACEQTGKPPVDEQKIIPSPEDCAIFLADHVMSDSIKALLRNLNLSDVDIADIEEKHRTNPKEFRIGGIMTAVKQAKGDRIAFLLKALERTKLNHQADLFCREFNIERPPTGQARQEQGGSLAQRPSQASTEDDFADSPGLEPRSDFETILQPFLINPASIHDISDNLSRERDFTSSQLRLFLEAFPQWKKEHRKCLEEKCKSRCTMDVLNCWASIEVERRQDSNPAQGIEYLALALRTADRKALLEKIKTYVFKGVVGPSLKRDMYLRDISRRLKNDIVKYFGLKKKPGINDWRALATYVGYGEQVQFWEQEQYPAEILWEVWKTRNDATVIKLYDWVVDNDRLDIATLLEKEV